MKTKFIFILNFICSVIITGCVTSCGLAPWTEKTVINPLPNPPSYTTPFVYEVPQQQTDWVSFNSSRINGRQVGQTSTQESNILRLEVRKNYGASIQIYDKVTGQSLINFKDLGRESGMVSYAGPRSFADDSPRWKGIGYNPLQAGDDGGNSSPLLFHGFINGWIYTKAQCLSWAHQDRRLLPFFYEQWVRVDSNKVHVNVRLTHQRADKTLYGPEAQEWPMLMVNGARKVHFYNGSNPYSNDETTITDGIESRTSTGKYVPHQRTPFGLTEPWQGIEIGKNSDGSTRLIGLYTKDFFWGGYNVDAIAANDSDESGNTITYIANLPLSHLDSDNTWYRSYTYVLGAEKDIRSYVYAQERMSKPEFIFDIPKGRNGWTMFNGGLDRKEPFPSDDWQVTVVGKVDDLLGNGILNGRDIKLLSPHGSWRADSFNDIYIQMAYKGPTGTSNQVPFRVAWVINGQAPEGLDNTFPEQNRLRFPRGTRDQLSQSVLFNVINDGQFHIYRINFADKSLWTGIIQQFEIAHSFDSGYVTPGEEITLRYFGSINPQK